MAKSLYDAVTGIVPFNIDTQENEDLKGKINSGKSDLLEVFLSYRKNPVAREVIEGKSTFAAQLEGLVNGNYKNKIELNKKKIALSECLGLNFPHSPGVYSLGFGVLGAASLYHLYRFAPRKSDFDTNPTNPSKGNNTKRDSLKKLTAMMVIAVGGSIGGAVGYGGYVMQIDSLSSRARYLDGVYRLVKQ